MSMSRCLKPRRCLLSPLRKKKKTMISPGRSFSTAKKRSKKKREASEQHIKKGDVVDISTLLFTKHRNYLLKGDNQRVLAKQLAGKHPSITTLLASPERNYVISNNGDQVPVSDLDDKTKGWSQCSILPTCREENYTSFWG
ncbi:hypothetical protein POM88_054927 [Heracleum sosnowskyi]|uniref:Uncharacterized protein n=1 Tax=Heracleum sosnowskyi TaxID=360622 RepID=A0AAD8LVP3_9APIA|nr:hypothetical protein POM88_054927 [Heracleum sosnowskyi]